MSLIRPWRVGFNQPHGAGTLVCPIIYRSWKGIGTCEVDSVFPPDDPEFGSDANMIVNLYIIST